VSRDGIFVSTNKVRVNLPQQEEIERNIDTCRKLTNHPAGITTSKNITSKTASGPTRGLIFF